MCDWRIDWQWREANNSRPPVYVQRWRWVLWGCNGTSAIHENFATEQLAREDLERWLSESFVAHKINCRASTL